MELKWPHHPFSVILALNVIFKLTIKLIFGFAFVD